MAQRDGWRAIRSPHTPLAKSRQVSDVAVTDPLKLHSMIIGASMSRRLPALILSLAVVVAAGAADQPAVKRTDEVREAGLPFATTVMVENTAAVAATVSATWTIQANPLCVDQAIPDAQLGIDHALGARCTLMVDGAERGDPLFCDGDDTSGYQTPWGKVGEAIATIDLGSSRPISAVRWVADDANWIFQADVSTSTDGTTWTPVAVAQGVAMKGKWGGPHTIPWSAPVTARHGRTVACEPRQHLRHLP